MFRSTAKTIAMIPATAVMAARTVLDRSSFLSMAMMKYFMG